MNHLLARNYESFAHWGTAKLRWARSVACKLIGPYSLTLIIILGTVLRVTYTLLYQPEPFADAAIFDERAQDMAQGFGYINPNLAQPTAYWPIGYPALLDPLDL